MKRKVSIALLVILILATIYIPEGVNAATEYKVINLSEKHVSVGKVKFSSTRDADSGKVTIYYKTNNKTKILASEVGLDCVILTNGRYAYYIVADDETTYSVFKKDIKTSSNKKLFSEKTSDFGMSLSGIYKNKLFYVKGIDPGTLCSYDLKSGKKKKIMENVTQAEQHGNVFLCTPYEGALGPSTLRAYDAKNNEKKTITKNKMSYQVIRNHLYYVEYVRAYDSNSHYVNPEDYICKVVRCNLTGKNKKVLLKNKRIQGYVSKITSSYIEYTHYDYSNNTQKVYRLKYK